MPITSVSIRRQSKFLQAR